MTSVSHDVPRLASRAVRRSVDGARVLRNVTRLVSRRQAEPMTVVSDSKNGEAALALEAEEFLAELQGSTSKSMRRLQSLAARGLYFIECTSLDDVVKARIAVVLARSLHTDLKVLDEPGRERFAKRCVTLSADAVLAVDLRAIIVLNLIRNSHLRNFSLDDDARTRLLDTMFALLRDRECMRSIAADVPREIAWNLFTGSLTLRIQAGRDFLDCVLGLLDDSTLTVRARADLASSLVACTKLNHLDPTEYQLTRLAEATTAILGDAALTCGERTTLILNVIDGIRLKRFSVTPLQSQQLAHSAVHVLPACEKTPKHFEALVVAFISVGDLEGFVVAENDLEKLLTAIGNALQREKMAIGPRERIAAHMLGALDRGLWPIAAARRAQFRTDLLKKYPTSRSMAATAYSHLGGSTTSV